MTAIVFTSRFERDLQEIGDYIAAYDPRAAVEFVEEIRRHCLLLTTSPLMGRPREELGPVRSLTHRPYTIFYRYSSHRDRVEVLRAWHGSRRPARFLDLRR